MSNLNSAAKVEQKDVIAKCCKVEGCTGKGDKNRNGTIVYSKGYCIKHYTRIIRHNDPLSVKCIRGEERVKNPLYKTYANMLGRCNNPNDDRFASYGGRGIKVCSEWSGVDGFTAFCKDMGKKSNNSLTLDRIDVNKGYCKENCRWATIHQQNANTTKSNKTVGVSYLQKLELWQASMMLNGKKVLQKYFKTEQEAIKSRHEAEIKHFGKLISEM